MRRIILLAIACCFGMKLCYAQNSGGAIVIERSRTHSTIDDFFNPELKPFYHGVASGDPLQNSVIIWTRVTPDTDEPISVNWRISTTPEMDNVVTSGVVSTDLSIDYTVKVDVGNLQPETTYYYDFFALGASSLVGRTKTAPSGNTDQLRFAVVSCSNYQDGFFNAYERISERNDLDAVVHLGDYIYEYESGDFSTTQRGHLPENEIVSLMDYRIRYSYYRLDEQLRKVHQQHPFITVWDDHEFANNAYVDGAQNHQADEGDWNVRKSNAYQAYFEWMPVRSPVSDTNPNQIYRKISYGDLMDLILLDTRIEGREAQEGVSARKASLPEVLTTTDHYKEFLNAELPATIKNELSSDEYNLLINSLADWALKELTPEEIKEIQATDEYKHIKSLVNKTHENEASNVGRARTMVDRQLLGETQFQWLEGNLINSEAQWKVVANQVLLMPLSGLGLTDTWDGYADSRERLLEYIQDNDIENVVFVTGDIHFTLAGDLPTSSFSYLFNRSNSAAVEYVTPSVTSSNLDEFIGISESFLIFLLELFNPQVQNSDLEEHGYFILTLDDDKAQADWYYVDDVKAITNGESNGASWLVNEGDTRLFEANGPIASSVSRQSERAPDVPREGNYNYSDPVMVIGNYPNPAVDYTIIHYALIEDSKVEIKILDLNGQEIKEILNENQRPNIYAFPVSTIGMTPGIYLYSVSTEKQKIVRKLIVK